MEFELQPLQRNDIERCVDIYFAAFQNPHSLACWPRIPSVRSFWENMIQNELSETGSHWLKTVAKDTGTIIGFAKWQEPKPGREPDTNLPDWPEGADKALCDETFGEWARLHRDLMGSRGHWCKSVGSMDGAWERPMMLTRDRSRNTGDSSGLPRQRGRLHDDALGITTGGRAEGRVVFGSISGRSAFVHEVRLQRGC